MAAREVPRARARRSSAGASARCATSAAATYEQTFDPDGPQADCWVYEDLVYINKRHVAAVGFDRDDMTMSPITYDEMRPGCYEPEGAHRRHGDELGRGVALRSRRSRASAARRSSRRRIASSREACVLAYNDWMVEEWCGDSGGRLIPLIIVPLWDAELAAAEVRRNAARGVHAVCFSEIPPHLGLPTIHSGEWDPFFAACEETETVVCMHIGSSSQMPATSADAPVAVAATLSFGNAMASLSDFLFSGVLVRFPTLKLAYSEGQIGWLPVHPRARRRRVERAPGVGRREGHRSRTAVDLLLPQVYGCFFRDLHGLESLDRVGVDNVTFETDYPHTDSTWPHTKEVARGHDGGSARRRRLQDRARQRDPHARRSTST